VSDTGSNEDTSPFQSRDDGQLHFEPGTAGGTFPVTAPEEATPLEDHEPEGTIPPSPLWAMKERAHGGFHLLGHPSRIRARAGEGDAAVYAIDDGTKHCMVGRRVGATADGCIYSLVARVDLATWQALESHAIDGRSAFLSAHEAGLSGTSNGTRTRPTSLRTICPRHRSPRSPRICRLPIGRHELCTTNLPPSHDQ
jgi:hypothetical protein